MQISSSSGIHVEPWPKAILQYLLPPSLHSFMVFEQTKGGPGSQVKHASLPASKRHSFPESAQNAAPATHALPIQWSDMIDDAELLDELTVLDTAELLDELTEELAEERTEDGLLLLALLDTVSFLQFAEHPSPFFVLPSSHSSGPTLRLSPQIGVQISGRIDEAEDDVDNLVLESGGETILDFDDEEHDAGVTLPRYSEPISVNQMVLPAKTMSFVYTSDALMEYAVATPSSVTRTR